MNQVWHIFRKDTRHFWREIVVLFALLIMYAWNEMRSWSHPGSRAYGMGSIWGISNELPGLVGVLILVIWLFLVIRIVHDEPLVGDRQFWVTRPYDWRALLAEKVLFSVAFINIPIFFLQVFLLAAAGFVPHNHLAGLLAAQIGIFMIAIFSTVFLSSITRTIPQFLFGIVAVIVYLIGASYINSKIPNSSFAGPIDAVQGGLVL